jgi:AcrR family transcriptional regulator
MRRRSYQQKRRAEQLEQKRERIVRATVALHAKHGVLGTSYPMIAARARVSTQTVYNHFPDLGELIGACTGHVMPQAPAVTPEVLKPGRNPEQRSRLLANAIYAQHAYLEPWMRFAWHEARAIPELEAMQDQATAGLKQLIALAVRPERSASAEFIDAALALLAYPGWKQLSQGRSGDAAAKLAGDCLAALLPTLTSAMKKEMP